MRTLLVTVLLFVFTAPAFAQSQGQIVLQPDPAYVQRLQTLADKLDVVTNRLQALIDSLSKDQKFGGPFDLSGGGPGIAIKGADGNAVPWDGMVQLSESERQLLEALKPAPEVPPAPCGPIAVDSSGVVFKAPVLVFTIQAEATDGMCRTRAVFDSDVTPAPSDVPVQRHIIPTRATGNLSVVGPASGIEFKKGVAIVVSEMDGTPTPAGKVLINLCTR